MEDGRARRTTLTLGHQTGQEAEVTGGLADGARIVLHPGDTLVDGRDPLSAPSNHSPHAAYDDRVLPQGAAFYATLAARRLAQS